MCVDTTVSMHAVIKRFFFAYMGWQKFISKFTFYYKPIKSDVIVEVVQQNIVQVNDKIKWLICLIYDLKQIKLKDLTKTQTGRTCQMY